MTSRTIFTWYIIMTVIGSFGVMAIVYFLVWLSEKKIVKS